MKKILFITLLAMGLLSSCSSDDPRQPKTAYMPDMARSRAYEAYNAEKFYREHVGDRRPQGAIARGEEMPYTLTNTNEGYAKSGGTKNPLEALGADELTEAKRLYLINCGICHGVSIDGNGPLYRGGEGPFPAKPATLVGDAKYMSMPEGTMFHSVYYGKNLMGSYASQLNTKQIWMIIYYIKQQQKNSLAIK